MSVSELCREFGVSRPTGYRWINRYKESGPEGLLNLSSKPHSCSHATPELAEGDGPQAAIGEHADVRRNGGGEPVDHHPHLALARQRVDHVARVGIGGLPGEPVVLGYVVQAARNPPQASGSNQPVEGLIDCCARSKVGEVFPGPDARLRRGGGTVPDGGWNAGYRSGHG
jgi:hypothetical protein